MPVQSAKDGNPNHVSTLFKYFNECHSKRDNSFDNTLFSCLGKIHRTLMLYKQKMCSSR